MIRWCSYCQRFLGERAPYDNPQFTHGICKSCESRVDRDEPVVEDTALLRGLVKRILASAREGDEAAFATIFPEARALGLDTESLLFGMLQPALYQAGLDWEDGSMSVAAEHRLSDWWQSVFAMFAPAPAPDHPAPIDLLVLQAPGNAHTIGPRLAAQVLAARGLSVEAISAALPLGETVEVARALRPRIVGFSCSLPAQVPGVAALIAQLRERLEPEMSCRWVLSGMAFRLGGSALAPTVGPDIEVLLDVSQLSAPPD